MAGLRASFLIKASLDLPDMVGSNVRSLGVGATGNASEGCHRRSTKAKTSNALHDPGTTRHDLHTDCEAEADVKEANVHDSEAHDSAGCEGDSQATAQSGLLGVYAPDTKESETAKPVEAALSVMSKRARREIARSIIKQARFVYSVLRIATAQVLI